MQTEVLQCDHISERKKSLVQVQHGEPSKQNDLDDNLERSVFCYYFSIFILVFNDKISLKPLIILANYVILGMLHYTHYNGLFVFFLVVRVYAN